MDGSFYLVLLSKGKNWTPTSSPEVQTLQQEHTAYQVFLHNHYRAVAGPFEYATHDLSGMTLIPAASLSLEEVTQLVNKDPAIKAGRLDFQIIKWHTPPGFLVLG